VRYFNVDNQKRTCKISYTEDMEKVHISFSSKIFFTVFALTLILSVASAHYRYLVLQDYEIFFELDETGQLINTEE
jgi:hypothetical protein